MPLNLWALTKTVSGRQLDDCLAANYAGKPCVKVMLFGGEPPAELNPEALNGTSQMELFVFENEKNQRAVLVARLDSSRAT